MTIKKIARIHRGGAAHWVGDGFPVRTLISYDRDPADFSPFLLLDHAGPAEFAPATEPRGVGQHPHRGFETVTIVYSGEVEHKDNAGNGGRIGPGDVQWMTAARGIIHEEFHSRDFTARGGTMEMVQLWVNLPARDKMAAPGYQEIVNRAIPEVALGGGSVARIIAGDYRDTRGPARTFTPVNVWDVRLAGGTPADIAVPDGFTTIMLVMDGHVTLNGDETAQAGELVLFERNGEGIRLAADRDAKLLVLSGEPIDEPVVGYGPFVMNTRAEIAQAVADFNAGRF